jgi:ABC-type glucose/galactose transport system permease subunit
LGELPRLSTALDAVKVMSTRGVMGSALNASSESKGESASCSDSCSVGILGMYSYSAVVVYEIGSVVESSEMGRPRASSQLEEELKLVMETSGIAGLSYEGQIGKLEKVLGQLVAEKQGRDTRGERGSHVINES